MRSIRLLVCSALALAGVGMLLTAGSLYRPMTASSVTGNYPVNSGATDPADISAHNSPVVAQNPTDPSNIVIANRIDSPTYSCALHVSTDASRTFSASTIPIPQGEGSKCYAPDIAFGPDGRLYLVFVTLRGRGNVPDAVWLSTSSDGGRTLSEPDKVLGPLSFQVRLTADPEVRDRIYMTWLAAAEVGVYSFTQPGNPIRFALSDDGGSTWSDPVQVNEAERLRVVAPAPAIASDGSINVVYIDLHDDKLDYHGAHGGSDGPPYPENWSLILARSTDGGESWRETVVDELVPTERFIVFLPPFPSVLTHPDDDSIFIAFHDGRLGDSDVWVWHSSDGGKTFSQAVRVNDTAPADGTAQYLPALGFAPSDRVDVVYFDRRIDPDNALNEVSLQFSTDGGEVFSPRVRLSDRSFDSRVGSGTESGIGELGSRLGLLSTDAEALVVWSDTRSGTAASAKQDLARAVVAFSAPSPLPAQLASFLRIGGWGLVALAAVGTLFSLRVGRSIESERDFDQDSGTGSRSAVQVPDRS